MTAPQDNGSVLLQREILAEAQRQRNEILNRARGEAEQLLTKASQEIEQTRTARLQVAKTEALRRQEAIRATIWIESGRLWLARTEELLESIHLQAAERLRAASKVAQREALAGGTVDAIHRMAGDDFVLRVAPTDRLGLDDGFVEDVRHRLARPHLNLLVREDSAIAEGAWLLQDKEGRQVWELGLTARLERLWPELRRQIAAKLGLTQRHEGQKGDR